MISEESSSTAGSGGVDPGGRRPELLAVALRALVGSHLGREVDATPSGLGAAVGLVDEGTAWVLVDGDASDRLGPALAWAMRAGADRLNLLGQDGVAVAARRAEQFRFPISVWRTEGRSLTPAEPEPLPDPVEPDPEHLTFVSDVIAGGAEVCIEHGVVTGEVRGLEVCRVVDGHGGPRLEIGVGTHDREAFALLHGVEAGPEGLSRVVAFVERHRRRDADHHPLNRLAVERFLRWHLINEPATVGAVGLEAIAPPTPRRSVSDAVPCVAVGIDQSDGDLVVVCATGVDLDLAPFVTDVRRAVDGRRPSSGERRLVIAVPRRQRLGIVDDVVAEIDQAPGWSDPDVISVD